MRSAIQSLESQKRIATLGNNAIQTFMTFVEKQPGRKLPVHPAYLEVRRILAEQAKLDLAAGTAYKRVRLLAGPRTNCHIVIALQGNADDSEGWILRCVQSPVRVAAPDIKPGIAKLKIDVREYGLFICTAAGDSVATNLCRLMPWPAVGRR